MVSTIRQDLGANLKDARLEKKLSQQALGDLAGMSKSDISNIESGKRNPSIDYIERLAVALGVEASFLIRRREEKL